MTKTFCIFENFNSSFDHVNMAFIHKHELLSFRHQGYNLQDDFNLHQSLSFVRNLEIHLIILTEKIFQKPLNSRYVTNLHNLKVI